VASIQEKNLLKDFYKKIKMVKSKITNNILSNQQINFKCASMLNQITKILLERQKNRIVNFEVQKV
jgi:hypothetical protein